MPEIIELCDYWRANPPTHELLAMLARCFTTWKPAERAAPQDADAQHRASLEKRWASGAMNAKQMLEALAGSGGVLSL